MSTQKEPAANLPPSTVLSQRYIIQKQAGRGGMGIVYQAFDQRAANRIVALKEIQSARFDNENDFILALQRFEQEAAILKALTHPNLPRIYETFTENNNTYLVMDYIEGKTLYQLMREQEGKPLPLHQVVHYAYQLCSVLAYLHQQNPPIIFRDVKPTNIMVTPSQHIFLIDFGIARFFKEGQSHDTEYLGSRGYAAPEQHGLAQTTPRADIYGLGATLHYCLTGEDPYQAHNPFTFAQISTINSNVPAALVTLIHQMVALDEKKRPESMLEVKQVLHKLERESVQLTTALPDTTPSSPQQAVPRQSQPVILAQSASPSSLSRPSLPVTPVVHYQPILHQPHPPQPRFSSLPNTQRNHRHLPTYLQPLSLALIFICATSALLTFNNHLYPWTAVSELLLALFLWYISAVTGWINKDLAPRSILALINISTLLTAIALFLSSASSIEAQFITSLHMPTTLTDDLLTGSLLANGILSLGWLFRPTSGTGRGIISLCESAIIACSLLQSLFHETDLIKSICIILTLSLLIGITQFAIHLESLYSLNYMSNR